MSSIDPRMKTDERKFWEEFSKCVPVVEFDPEKRRAELFEAFSKKALDSRKENTDE